MVKYTIDAINAVLQTLQPLPGRPTFGGLWQFNRQLAECLRNLKHPTHTTYGWAGYIMQERAYALLTNTPWTDPPDVGMFFTVPDDAITETDQRSREREWNFKKEMRDTLLNIETCLRTTFERCIDKNYHSSTSGGMGQRGFGNDQPRDISKRLMTLYGKPTVHELEGALKRLLDPMERNDPIEVMLRDIEDVQMFLLAHPEGDKEMSEPQLIDYAMIKLSKTGGLYSKGMTRWRQREPNERKKWTDFVPFMVKEYERLQTELGGTTLGQEGYGNAFMGAENTPDDDGSSLAASVVEYVEKASHTDTRVSELEARLAAFELGTQGTQQQQYGPIPSQAMYYMPEYSYMAPQQPPPPSNIQFSGKKQKRNHEGGSFTPRQQTMPTQQYPQQQQGGWTNNARQQRRGRNKPNNAPYSNTVKTHMNLWYCFSCGCDVDHNGFQCPAQKMNHIENVRREDAHKVLGACMKAAHKTLPDGTGAQPGYILAKQLSKPLWYIQQQEQYRQMHQGGGQQQQYQPQQQQQRGGQWGPTQQQQQRGGQWGPPQQQQQPQQQWGQNNLQQQWGPQHQQGNNNWQQQWRK